MFDCHMFYISVILNKVVNVIIDIVYTIDIIIYITLTDMIIGIILC